MRFFDKVTTFGDVDLPIYTHELEDIGRVTAMGVTDARTMNKCLQLDFNGLTQKKMGQILKESFPDYRFEFKHYSKEDIIYEKENASDKISAKKGAETDKERWGINYVLYVKGKLASFDDETVRGTALYPDYTCLRTPEKTLRDPTFVFENKVSA